MSQPAAPATLNIRVFTQPGSKAEILPPSRCFPLLTQQRTLRGQAAMSAPCHQEASGVPKRRTDLLAGEAVDHVFDATSCALERG